MNIFEQYTHYRRSIEIDQERIARLRESAYKTPTSDPAKEFSGGGFSQGSRFSRIIDETTDMEQLLKETIGNMLQCQAEVYRRLKELDAVDSKGALILRMRYIQEKSPEEIAVELRLSKRRVQDILSRAIKKCENF